MRHEDEPSPGVGGGEIGLGRHDARLLPFRRDLIERGLGEWTDDRPGHDIISNGREATNTVDDDWSGEWFPSASALAFDR